MESLVYITSMEPAKFDLDSRALRLDMTTSLSLEENHEFFISFHGIIVAERIDDPQFEPGEARLGEVGLHLIKVANAVEEYGSLEAVFDVADSISSELGEVIQDVVCGGEDAKVYEAAFGCVNLLLIEKINIRPEYRRLGIGGRVVGSICRAFNYCELIALKPFAIELPKHDRDETEDARAEKMTAFRKGTERLTKYYERFGFRLIFGEHMTFCPQLLEQPTSREAKRARAEYLAKRESTLLQ